jgi:RecG-like helicase
VGLLRRKAEAVDLKAAPTPRPACTPIVEVVPRQLVTVIGDVQQVTVRPTSGQPALLIVIGDGTGKAAVVWTGRRSLGAMRLGRTLAISGTAGMHNNRLEFTNPAYTLLP